jgi:hypothetical protein
MAEDAAASRASQDPPAAKDMASLLRMRRALDGVMEDMPDHSKSTTAVFLNVWRRIVRALDDGLMHQLGLDAPASSEEEGLNAERDTSHHSYKNHKKHKKDKKKKKLKKAKPVPTESPAASPSEAEPAEAESAPHKKLRQHEVPVAPDDDEDELDNGLDQLRLETAAASLLLRAKDMAAAGEKLRKAAASSSKELRSPPRHPTLVPTAPRRVPAPPSVPPPPPAPRRVPPKMRPIGAKAS